MKNAFVQLCFLVVVITSIHAIRLMKKSTINGKIAVANSVNAVCAIQGSDTVKAQNIKKNFELKVTPGTWKIFISTNKPYKNTYIEKVLVSEGNDIDLGEIALEQ